MCIITDSRKSWHELTFRLSYFGQNTEKHATAILTFELI